MTERRLPLRPDPVREGGAVARREGREVRLDAVRHLAPVAGGAARADPAPVEHEHRHAAARRLHRGREAGVARPHNDEVRARRRGRRVCPAPVRRRAGVLVEAAPGLAVQGSALQSVTVQGLVPQGAVAQPVGPRHAVPERVVPLR